MASDTHDQDREKRALAALNALLHVTARLTEDAPLEELLRAVTDCALTLMPGNHASIRLVDPSRDQLIAGARSGASLDVRPLSFRRGEGLIGWAVQHGESIRSGDMRTDLGFAELDGEGFTINSVLVEPLHAQGHVIGALSVTSHEKDAFDEDDALLMRLLANCSVSPIERARLRQIATFDDLTMAFNHRFLYPRLREELERAKRTEGGVLSLLLFDLDHFKQVNDTHGHPIGDRVLRIFADRIRANVRRNDVLIRRGGEEFVLVMPQATEEQAKITAERIRATLDNDAIVPAPDLRLHQTVSIGVATWNGAETAEELEGRADAAMYIAKGSGRNRVQSSLPPPMAHDSAPAPSLSSSERDE